MGGFTGTSMASMYRRMADDCLKKVKAYPATSEPLRARMKQLREANVDLDHADWDDVIDALLQASFEAMREAVSATVFAAMAAESFIFEYGAERLGDGYVRDHLDNLKLEAKWLIYPRLVCGRSLDNGGRAMDLLRKLVKSRNRLVHYKRRPSSVRAEDPTDPMLHELEVFANEALQALDHLARELDAIDPQAKARQAIGQGTPL